MAGEFWLSDRQWAVIDPLLPKNQSGAHRGTPPVKAALWGSEQLALLRS